MADGIGMDVRGLSEVDAIFEKMGDQKQAQMAGRHALREGAKVIQEGISSRAPERPQLPSGTALPPGVLKRDIEIHVRTAGDGKLFATVGPGKYTSHVARWVEYGHRMIRGGRSRLNKKTGLASGKGQEVGFVPAHPFIRPGYEATQDQAERKMKDVLLEDLKKTAQKLKVTL